MIGTRPDWASNLQPFEVWDDAPTNCTSRPELHNLLIRTAHYQAFSGAPPLPGTILLTFSTSTWVLAPLRSFPSLLCPFWAPRAPSAPPVHSLITPHCNSQSPSLPRVTRGRDLSPPGPQHQSVHRGGASVSMGEGRKAGAGWFQAAEGSAWSQGPLCQGLLLMGRRLDAQ